MTTNDTKITQSLAHFRLPDPPRLEADEATRFDQLSKTGNVHHLIQHFGNLETMLVEANRRMVASPSTDLARERQPDLLIESPREARRASTWAKSATTTRTRASRSAGGFTRPGEFYGVGLAGDRLVDGAYQTVPIGERDGYILEGHSAALNVNLRWENGSPGWCDPVPGQHILAFEDQRRRANKASSRYEREVRLAAEARVREPEPELRRLPGN